MKKKKTKSSEWEGLEFKPRLAGVMGIRPITTEECCMEPKPYPATECCPTAVEGLTSLGLKQ